MLDYVSGLCEDSGVKTEPLSPAKIFMMPQRLLVPLFQRPYVWNQPDQWDPLWRDVIRVANRLLKDPTGNHQPHFLGAVVFQQVQSPAGDLQQRTVIDGQQRLTTLQLMFDAIHEELVTVNAKIPAAKLLKLVENDVEYRTDSEDKFKVWPTNKDRPSFNEVMAAPTPVDYSSLKYKNSKLVLGHKFFSESCRSWLNEDGPTGTLVRAEAMSTVLRELLQIVVIDLEASENAQEIFETLNARGAVLTAADLIKNFVFQRLQESSTDVEKAYEDYWKVFESPFWEQEVSYGRVKFQRSSLFIYQWLVSKTGEEILAREVFSRFKHYADYECEKPIFSVLEELHQAAEAYATLMEQVEKNEGEINRVAMFGYRLRCLELDVLRPVLIHLIDPCEVAIPKIQFEKAIVSLESWMVRRLVVRVTNKGYNKLVPEIIAVIRKSRATAGDALENYFVKQNVNSSYWPDDAEVLHEVNQLPIYRKLYTSRIRMILEAIEDNKRGWNSEKSTKSGTRVKRSTFAIEHLMPQAWEANWHLGKEETLETRNHLLQTIGNLTLLTTKHNSALSNGPWPAKRASLIKNDVLLMNTELQSLGETDWDETRIESRTTELLSHFIAIWPTPKGFKTNLAEKVRKADVSVSVSDLISAGLVTPGQVLSARQKAHTHRTATILEDGQIQVGEKVFDSLSLAGFEVLKRNTNGWTTWLVSKEPRISMREVREEYRESLGLESAEDQNGDLEDE
jgi:hypothetical protein